MSAFLTHEAVAEKRGVLTCTKLNFSAIHTQASFEAESFVIVSVCVTPDTGEVINTTTRSAQIFIVINPLRLQKHPILREA